MTVGIPADPEARRLRALAKAFAVADRVRLYGSVARQDMPSLLRSADVVACTPRDEPFGLVALEAMACGVPIVASAVGGLLDTVVDDVTGRLVNPKRPGEIADAVNNLMRDEFLRQSLGAAGRDRARARYSCGSRLTLCASTTRWHRPDTYGRRRPSHRRC